MALVEDTQEAEVTQSSDDLEVVLDMQPLGEQQQIPICAAMIEDVRVWTPPKRERWTRLGIFAFACLMYLPNLGAFGLWDPWETHYGAVTTDMLETHDWISPFWGYPHKVGDDAGEPEGKGFFSKPIYTFWSEGIVARIIGRGEWAIRLPFALLAILAVFLAYLTLSKIWSRRVGVVGSVVLATSPQWFMISRQAQTDMPFVANMTMALCFIMLAMFGPREQISDKKFKRWSGITLAFILLNTIPQYVLIANDIAWGWLHALVWLVILLAALAWVVIEYRKQLAADGLTDAFKDRWLRRFYLVGFYVLVGHAMYGKGQLLGAGLPAGVVFVYLLLSKNWRALGRLELVRGLAIFVCVGLPWTVAVMSQHGWIGGAYWNRFIMHDQVNRFFGGVHQIDSGTFEHFIEWLGVGTFPWVAFAPLALLSLFALRVRDNLAKNQAKVFVAGWFLTAFAIFTISSTKFHHYIFPALPALAIIIALYLVHLLKEGGWIARFSTVVAIILFSAVAWNIHEEPQELRNLMTYKYDRPMPGSLPIDADAKVNPTSDLTWKESQFFKQTSPFLQTILTTKAFEYETFIEFLLIAGLLALTLFFVAKTRLAALIALALLASALTMWSLNYYMPSLTPHWSQKYIFDAYYEDCTLMPESDYVKEAYTPLLADIGLGGVADYFRSEPKRLCEEDIISWMITWRGETYYSYNEIIPIRKKDKHWEPYLRDYNGGNTFYALTERNKEKGLAGDLQREGNKLAREYAKDGNPQLAGWADIEKWETQVIGEDGWFFQIVKYTPVRKAAAK